MGNIPLPALQIDPQKAPDLMSQYANLLKLQGQRQNLQQSQAMAPLQQQQAQQSVQSGQLQLQQQQQAQKDQQATTAAYAQWDGKDYDDLAHLTLKNGGSGDAVAKIQQTGAAQKAAASKQALQDAQTGSAVLANQMKKNDLITGPLGVLVDPKQVPDAQLPQQITQTVQQLGQMKGPDGQPLLDQQHVQAGAQIAQMAQSNPAQARQALDTMRKGMMANSQILSEAKDRAETSKDTAQGNEATVNAGLAPQLAASKEAFQQAQLRQGQQRLGIEGAGLQLRQQQSGISSNGAPSDLAQAIASGHVTPERMSYLLTRNPALVQGVMQIDPSFDSSKAAAYPKVYADFTSSKNNTAGGALLAGSVALQHLNELKGLNTVESHIPGTPDYNAYQNKVDTVSGELARFYGTDTVPGIENIKKTLSATLPRNRDAAILTQAKSMGDRLNGYEQTWQNAAPSAKYEAPMPGISQAAKDARAALDPAYKASLVSQRTASNGMVTVQIPGSPAGQIPAAALQKFKQDHPNAMVSQ